MTNTIVPVGPSLWQLPVSGDTFSIATPPTTSSATKVALAPNFTAGPTGLDPYRSWSVVTLDGLFYLANGFDQPKRWDKAGNFYSVGSTAPTTFAVADAAGGSTHAAGTVFSYYLVFRNSTIGKETAPQLTASVPGVAHTMSGTKDIDITWTDPGGEFDKARIYRRLQNSDNYKLIAEVAAATATYTDATADATALTAEGYVTTYRATLPPIFRGMASHQGRLFGWKKDESNLHYSQSVRIDDELRAEDFPDDSILQPGAEDGTGGITNMLPHYGSATIFKRRAAYELTGSEPALWAIRRLAGDRGCLGHNCIVEIEKAALILDERGIYWWMPSGVAVVAGAREGSEHSPLQPTFDRMNLAAADTFFAILDRAAEIVRFFVALDYEPVPNVAIVFDYGANRFVSIDTACWGTAAGYLEDAVGVQHLIRGCDLGYLWEEEYAESQGVFAGDGTGTLTAATVSLLTDSAASFDTTTASGAPGVPMERYDSAGALLDLNRVFSATGTALTTYLYPDDTPAAGDTVAVGVIPAIARTPRMTFNTPEEKWLKDVIVEHDNGVSGDLRVDVAKDEDAYALEREFDLTTNIWTLVATKKRGWTFGVQVSQRYANLGFTVRGVHIKYHVVPGART